MRISKKMLIHSCLLYCVIGKDADRNPIYSEAVELSHVWIFKTEKENNGSLGSEPSDIMTLYFDVNNSESSGEFTWNMGDKIVFEDKEFFINSKQSCYGFGGIEHYEIGLR